MNLIHRTTRERLLKAVPELQFSCAKCSTLHDEGAHIRFLAHYCFSPFIDEVTGYKRVGARTVSLLAGRYKDFFGGRFNSKKVLDHINNEVLPKGLATLYLDSEGRDYTFWDDYSEDSEGKKVKISDSRERQVILELSDELKSIINDELSGKYDSEDEVYIDSGLMKSEKKERAAILADKESAMEIVELMDCEIAKNIAFYMNNLPSNTFSSLMENVSEAESFIKSLPEDTEEQKNRKLHQQLTLRAIKERPVPLYQPVKNSVRLFTEGSSLQNLSRHARALILQGTWNADLSSAQLAIIANLWNIQEVKDFLKSGRKLWKELISFYGFNCEVLSPELYEGMKDILKKYVYSTIFGMGIGSLVEGNEGLELSEKAQKEAKKRCVKKVKGLNKELSQFGIDKGGEKFLQFPLIKAILVARKNVIKTMQMVGSAYDAFGKKIIVRHDNVIKVMAGIAQSYEMKVIYPIFELASSTKEFRPILYLFDGCVIKFSSKQEYWIDRITKAVDQVAKELEIDTCLVWTENKAKEEVVEIPSNNLPLPTSYNIPEKFLYISISGAALTETEEEKHLYRAPQIFNELVWKRDIHLPAIEKFLNGEDK